MPHKINIENNKIFIDEAASLSRVFSRSVIGDLASKGSSRTMVSILKEAKLDSFIDEKSTLRECFDSFYKLIFKHYRNEYVYKNTIAKNILLGKYSARTSCMLTEFRISNSKADILLLNGTSHVYEIKTDFDSLERLPKQIFDYKKAVDYVSVITSASYVSKVLSCIDDDVGVLILNDRGSISTIRPPSSNKERVDPGVIFDFLKKGEYLEIIKSSGVEVQDVPNTLIYKKCREVFLSLDPVLCHAKMLESVKERILSEDLEDFILLLPASLKSIAYSMKLSKADKRRFLNVLDSKIIDLV